MHWLSVPVLRAIHAELVCEHGSLGGVRDVGALEAACDRPQQIAAYRPDPSLFELAAALGYSIARTHPFVDGNKRVALMAVYVFVRINGYRLTAPEIETVAVFSDLAAGTLNETELATWLTHHAEAV